MGGWIIQHDYIENSEAHAGQGVVKKEEAVPFILLDDDGDIYYGGIISKSWLYGSAEKAFAPLDWAMGNAGCTEMKYWHERKWVTL